MIRLLLADDHPIVRQGLRALIGMAGDMEIVAECDNGTMALDLIITMQPDIALLDISMPNMDGITLAGKLLKMGAVCRVIILTAHDDPALFELAYNQGVHGYLPKGCHQDTLLMEIRRVATGGPLSGRGTGGISTGFRARSQLTVREREILGLIANGLTSRMIADNLAISINTVDNHRSNIMQKLGFHSTAELVRYAYQTGLM